MCNHINTHSTFKDLIRGAGGDIYIRSEFKCCECDFIRYNTILLPKIIKKVIDTNIEIKTLTKKKKKNVKTHKKINSVSVGRSEDDLMKFIKDELCPYNSLLERENID